VPKLGDDHDLVHCRRRRLGRWPEFSPKTVELVVPMAIEPTDGRILLDPKKPVKRFFAAALWEESLVRPYDRCQRSWRC
jgi:hypothetical protein